MDVALGIAGDADAGAEAAVLPLIGHRLAQLADQPLSERRELLPAAVEAGDEHEFVPADARDKIAFPGHSRAGCAPHGATSRRRHCGRVCR